MYTRTRQEEFNEDFAVCAMLAASKSKETLQNCKQCEREHAEHFQTSAGPGDWVPGEAESLHGHFRESTQVV